MIRMTDEEGDARFLASRRSSFVSSFFRYTTAIRFVCQTSTPTHTHVHTSRTQKQRYSISSLNSRVHMSARQGTHFAVII